MTRIKRADNGDSYHGVDWLDGKQLRAGDRLALIWPDGTETVETIGVENISCRCSDGSERHAFVSVDVRGILTKVYLTLNVPRGGESRMLAEHLTSGREP